MMVEEQVALKNPCKLCSSKEATQKNSHIIPSFLCARVLSYDGSGRRDKDVTFTITESSQSVHVGEISSEEYDKLFDQKTLTDERIERLKPNPMAEDNYLCPDCEKKRLSDQLETPYAAAFKAGKPVDGGVGLFFWVSVFWRLSITHNLGEGFNQEANVILKDYLKAFLAGKLEKRDVAEIIEQCPITYKVLYNPDYLKDDAGFFFFKTSANKTSGILLCGDLAVWLGVEPDENIDFFGLQVTFQDAPINNGQDEEKMKLVSKEWFGEAKNALISTLKDVKIGNERFFLNLLWSKMGMVGNMPTVMQNEIIESVHGEGLKLGDRGEYKLWAPIILRVTNKYLFGENNG